MTNRQVLLLIIGFVALTLGSFIWYVVTWDPDERTQGVVPDGPRLALLKILPPEASTSPTGEII